MKAKSIVFVSIKLKGIERGGFGETYRVWPMQYAVAVRRINIELEKYGHTESEGMATLRGKTESNPQVC